MSLKQQIGHVKLPPRNEETLAMKVCAAELLRNTSNPLPTFVLQDSISHRVAVILSQSCNMSSPSEDRPMRHTIKVLGTKCNFQALYFEVESLHECLEEFFVHPPKTQHLLQPCVLPSLLHMQRRSQLQLLARRQLTVMSSSCRPWRGRVCAAPPAPGMLLLVSPAERLPHRRAHVG